MKSSDLLRKYNSDKVTVHSYGDFYDTEFGKLTEPLNLLEIGVLEGASLRAWRELFPESAITGIDIKSSARIEGVTLIQADIKTVTLDGKFDVILDDSSHDLLESMYEVLNFLPNLTEKGMLIIEDVQIPETYLSAYKSVLPEGYKIDTYDRRYVNGKHDDFIVKITKK